MSGTEAAAVGQAGSNNASEFVRKLFRMLEDPSHQDVARWGKDGDTFVVVEGEKFTRSILPKHFKHSNMSSFIRQLNKYDFHKVKPSSDAESSSHNGNVLEFKHPYFRIDSKDDLDNIRRKAPAPRKPHMGEDYSTNQHIGVISDQLTATQHQVQQLQELFTEVSQTNRILVNEVLTLQKMLNAQKQAQHEMLNYLTPYDGQQAAAPTSSAANVIDQSTMGGSASAPVSEADDTVPELRRARELLSSVTANSVADRELERLHGVYGSPADSGSMIAPVIPMFNDPMNDITRYPVYPVGQTVGIDPFHSDNINKIPYAMPNDMDAALSDPQQAQQAHQQQQQQQQVQQAQYNMGQQQTTPGTVVKTESLWGHKRPLVFLVEDDAVCAKIGIKFLKSMGCEVEHASDGVEAYNRVADNTQEQFDLIFMDIIMPRLDGVSASLYIRPLSPSTPIVAMTSNIRPDEVQSYFQNGMNGVLAKPFTREGMLKSVRANMAHLLKNPPVENDAQSYFVSNSSYIPTPANAYKFDGAGATSPGAPGWTTSPAGQNLDQGGFGGMLNGGGGNQYNVAQGAGRTNYADKMGQETSAEKRQRLNPSGGYA